MRLSLCLLTTIFFSNTSFAEEIPARDPIGEMADYKVDRASARTSGMIQSGNMKAVVNSYQPDHPDGPSYNVQIDYTLRIQFLGTRTGTQVVTVPETYFSPEFMQDLRSNGEYISDSFKVQHLGYADARNMDGGVYSNCDKIKIYDVQKIDNGLTRMADDILKASERIEPKAGIEDMVIVAHIKEGLPVLGAAKIDVSGVYDGVRVKAGADYERP
jgi:hypothetical protein